MAKVTISQHSNNGTTPVSAHNGITDVGRVSGAVAGYTELTQHTGNTGTPAEAHSGVPSYSEVSGH